MVVVVAVVVSVSAALVLLLLLDLVFKVSHDLEARILYPVLVERRRFLLPDPMLSKESEL